ncbi:GEM-like protein 1 [Zingiber officinale]|uniref:GRAM domain-containing protein n=1 Tax=Zingiber officinale TaxID=94328 RepID=A0A8J5HCI5_ZINOF|nr:GEM-like protein 1 [Zingiber officinale]KAG6524168.1 hypothetical protein ZIOFF_014059 [Zingiber officinale]
MNPVGYGDKKESEAAHSAGYAPYPKLTPEDVAPASVTATAMPPEFNPYIVPSPAPSAKSKRDTMRDVLDKFGKRVNETAKKTEDLAGNFWQHLKTGPSITDAAMGRIAQTTKVISEGGYEKVFHQTFEILPGEKLKKSYACYLSTSSGPVMGVLYLSTAKLAFCSDNPLSYKVGDQTQWSYYKVVIPLHQLRSASPCVSKEKPGEKYVQIVLFDNHEFWFIGFVNYDSAVINLQKAVPGTPHAHV